MQATEWKVKSIQRTVDNKQLKKRIKELTHSRDVWKQKSLEYKLAADLMKKKLKKTKRLMMEIVSQPL